jgi:aspartate/glutamate racemase
MTLKNIKKIQNKTRKRKCLLSQYGVRNALYYQVTNNIRKFRDLQLCLAKKENSEYQRPMVHLHIYNNLLQKPVYLLGGMGPLSDVQFLTHLKKMLKNTTFNIHLFSLPPPRSIFHFRKIYYYTKMIRHIQTYIIPRNSCVYLLSNSAHLYRYYLNLLNLNTYNMLPSITNMIQTHSGPFLILSTHNDIYTDISNSIQIDTKQKHIILECVNEIKENRYNYNKNPLLKMILSILQLYSQAHIVLACTELSIWYKYTNNKFLKQYIIHDTSFMMSKIIAERIQKQNT